MKWWQTPKPGKPQPYCPVAPRKWKLQFKPSETGERERECVLRHTERKIEYVCC